MAEYCTRSAETRLILICRRFLPLLVLSVTTAGEVGRRRAALCFVFVFVFLAAEPAADELLFGLLDVIVRPTLAARPLVPPPTSSRCVEDESRRAAGDCNATTQSVATKMQVGGDEEQPQCRREAAGGRSLCRALALFRSGCFAGCRYRREGRR